MVNGILSIAILAIFVSCGGGGRRHELQDGYFLKWFGGNSLLHQSSNSQLWRRIDNRDNLIWPFIVGQQQITNGIAIFNGGLSDESKQWQISPALFLSHTDGTVWEITAALMKSYCASNNTEYASLAGRVCLQWPELSNGVWTVTIRTRRFYGDIPGPNKVSFGTNDIDAIVERANKTGFRTNYDGGTCIISK